MKGTWWESVKHRISSAWDVLTGRAWAGYGDPSNWRYIEARCNCGVTCEGRCPICLSIAR